MSILRTARKTWCCNGCEGTFAAGSPKWYTRGQRDDGMPMTLHVCQMCREVMAGPHFDAEFFPFREPEHDEPFACSRWSMTIRAKHVMRAHMVKVCQFPPASLAQCARDALVASRTKGIRQLVHDYQAALSTWYWRRHDAALACIPGPLAEV